MLIIFYFLLIKCEELGIFYLHDEKNP